MLALYIHGMKKKNRFLLHQQKDEMGRKAPTPKNMTDEEMTETEILAELQRGLMPDLEAEEEEEEAEEGSAIEPNVCSLVDAKHHLQEVRRYLEFCSFTSDVEFSIMSQLETSLMINVSHRQPSIQDFF